MRRKAAREAVPLRVLPNILDAAGGGDSVSNLSRRVASIERRVRPKAPPCLLVIVIGEVPEAEYVRAVEEARRRGEGIVILHAPGVMDP